MFARSILVRDGERGLGRFRKPTRAICLGLLAYPSVTLLAKNLPLTNLNLFVIQSKSFNPQPRLLVGREHLEFAAKFEGDYFDNPSIESLYPDGKVRHFLQSLAEKGLAKRMLFPPPTWEGRPLRHFCIEPCLMTEAQWEEFRRQKPEYGAIPHEMELASETVMRGTLRGGSIV